MTTSRPTTGRRSLQVSAVLLLAAAGLVALPPAARAAGAAPDAPVLVAPANAATGVAAGAPLQVRASDPEGDPLQVRYFGRPRAGTAANPAADFTFMVLPDTQNYTSAAANRPTMAAQTQWIADSRSRLNTVFSAQVGDLVGVSTSTVQWQAASSSMSTLDTAGVPNTVVPGNHDLVIATGEAPEYRRYFPPSRYAQASWNSPAASYGGYLGQNLFGPDPAACASRTTRAPRRRPAPSPPGSTTCASPPWAPPPPRPRLS